MDKFAVSVILESRVKGEEQIRSKLGLKLIRIRNLIVEREKRKAKTLCDPGEYVFAERVVTIVQKLNARITKSLKISQGIRNNRALKKSQVMFTDERTTVEFQEFTADSRVVTIKATFVGNIRSAKQSLRRVREVPYSILSLHYRRGEDTLMQGMWLDMDVY